MKKYIALLVLLLVSACKIDKKLKGDRFKLGTFEIPAIDNYSKQTIVRVDSIQIESFSFKKNVVRNGKTYIEEKKRVDTFYIKWKNNFQYILRMKSPKSKLDKKPTFVQINETTDSSYNFTARIGYSKFKQKGTLYKIK